eukprot:TRINITY_DN16901_c0_g1_i1.p1 TRINITY_DN16901_c0_g1~~TRINITY_DN16901_c0_g1_i1.p1  ORF type:complete len:203 (+),score=48.61 TRINITY_DN16901_c0_g1_i1:91-699(+)
MSLSKLLEEHRVAQARVKQANERRKERAQINASKVTNGMMDAVNLGVERVFKNQHLIEKEASLLQRHTTEFTKQTAQWLLLIDNFNKALKELGDIENWAETIEKDMFTISKLLEFAHKQSLHYSSDEDSPEQEEREEQGQEEENEEEEQQGEEKQVGDSQQNAILNDPDQDNPEKSTTHQIEQQQQTSPTENLGGETTTDTT